MVRKVYLPLSMVALEQGLRPRCRECGQRRTVLDASHVAAPFIPTVRRGAAGA